MWHVWQGCLRNCWTGQKLKGLEAEDGKKPAAPVVSAAAEEVQSNLFSSSIIDELAHADVMGMTPIEAMNMLFRLSKEAKEGR